MKKLAAIGFLSFCGFLVFSCQNDLAIPVEEPSAVTVSERATPSDAIELTATNNTLVIEGGKNYVIRGQVSANGFTSSTNVSNESRLYIEGTLYLDDPGVALAFPDGLLTTINGGGSIVGYAEQITFGSNCSLYIQKQGKLAAGNSFMSFRINTTESTLINYGTIELYDLFMRNIPFYNMSTGNAYVCSFFTLNSAEVSNFGTFVNCLGEPYNY